MSSTCFHCLLLWFSLGGTPCDQEPPGLYPQLWVGQQAVWCWRPTQGLAQVRLCHLSHTAQTLYQWSLSITIQHHIHRVLSWQDLGNHKQSLILGATSLVSGHWLREPGWETGVLEGWQWEITLQSSLISMGMMSSLWPRRQLAVDKSELAQLKGRSEWQPEDPNFQKA